MQTDIFANTATRMSFTESIGLTAQSLNAYGPQHRNWCIAWSGGKDSSALLSAVLYLIDQGEVGRPESLTVFYADTRMELPPLAESAKTIMSVLEKRGIEVQVVTAPLDDRFFVYMLGRGVPPPNNGTLRWCTPQIKVEPMESAISSWLSQSENALMLTGLRIGESAVRDARITLACSKDGGECGQGWYQKVLPNAKGIKGRLATLAPILHWRVCHVWGWLREEMAGLPTSGIADAYGGDQAEDINARTGCIGCPLASRDTALETILKNPKWFHLAPLLELKPLYRFLREPQNRLRKSGLEKRKDGSAVHNPNRMGPLTMQARMYALEKILDIQARAGVDLINAEEKSRILELIDLNTWPNKWSGEEPVASKPFIQFYQNGTSQPIFDFS